jgi:hypothetical protein
MAILALRQSEFLPGKSPRAVFPTQNKLKPAGSTRYLQGRRSQCVHVALMKGVMLSNELVRNEKSRQL